MSNEIADFSKKSDDWLVGAIRSNNPQQISLALETLETRYGASLRKQAYSILKKGGWIEPDDIVQEVFLGFMKTVRVHDVREGVKQLLRSITHNKCMDAIKLQNREMELEGDIPISEYQGVEINLEKNELRQFAHQLPFTAKLSECQRLVLSLRTLHEYPPVVVARLMGKSRGTIDTHFSKANERLIDYFEGQEYEVDLASLQQPSIEGFVRLPKASLVVEMFANPINPHFTTDELKPLGLDAEEFHTHYIASLIMPWEPADKKGELGQPSLLLTRRTEWQEMVEMFNRLKQDKNDTDQLSPEQCLIKVDIDANDNFLLNVEQILEILPEPETWKGSDRSDGTRLSVHRPKVNIPVTLGFFDTGLYTPELHQRWPFLPEESDLYQL